MMENSSSAGAWTPGPWRTQSWSDKEAGVYAMVAGKKSDICGYALKPNARLIAAAPDLLDTLEALVGDVRAGVSHTTGIFEQADRVIARARASA